MSQLYQTLGPQSDYVDKKSGFDRDQWLNRLQKSSTVYVGNLTFYTTEDQIYELFSKCGEIELIVMGLNRKKKSPCGFCFVRFCTHSAANRAVEFLNGIQFDNRRIRVDWDSGDGITDESRKCGRGIHGLQWRDEFRKTYDADRGGEGGGINYSSFRGRGRKRNFGAIAGGYRQWERYGDYFERSKNARPRLNQRHLPPPPVDGSSLKTDLSQSVPFSIYDTKLNIPLNPEIVMDIETVVAATTIELAQSSLKPDPQDID